jgi:hypothetical protein
MFWPMVIAPALVGLATFAAIWLQERGRYMGLALVTFLAMLYFVFIFFIVMVVPSIIPK